MTKPLWVLAAIGMLIALLQVAAVVYTVYRIQRGEDSLSRYFKNAPRWAVWLVGLTTGVVIGFLAGHWWPVTGGV